jgi:hypothetical protein
MGIRDLWCKTVLASNVARQSKPSLGIMGRLLFYKGVFPVAIWAGNHEALQVMAREHGFMQRAYVAVVPQDGPRHIASSSRRSGSMLRGGSMA